uniref:Uncharacterized protein n=1 Tax=Arundo donax TaxID=35708 RepID=A0A0A9H067_ARUDO
MVPGALIELLVSGLVHTVFLLSTRALFFLQRCDSASTQLPSIK